MREKILTPKGHVTIYLIEGKRRIKVFDDHNDILLNAKHILCRCLSGVDNFINFVSGWKAGVEIAAAPKTGVSYPALNQVAFTFLYDEASFDDTLDELRLTSSTGGDFSQITNLSITKTSSQKFEIVWKLTFEDCAVPIISPLPNNLLMLSFLTSGTSGSITRPELVGMVVDMLFYDGKLVDIADYNHGDLQPTATGEIIISGFAVSSGIQIQVAYHQP